jgi:hypothetical protein
MESFINIKELSHLKGISLFAAPDYTAAALKRRLKRVYTDMYNCSGGYFVIVQKRYAFCTYVFKTRGQQTGQALYNNRKRQIRRVPYKPPPIFGAIPPQHLLPP